MHTDLYNPYEKKFLSQIGVEPVTLTINVSVSSGVENSISHMLIINMYFTSPHTYFLFNAM